MGSILQYPDAINPPEMQIWNNAAFDNGEWEDSSTVNRSSSWWSQSLESSCSKENLSPVMETSPVPAPPKSSISSLPIKPLQSKNSVISQGTPMKIVLKHDLVPKKVVQEEEKARDERKIDLEIEEIEKEIKRLSSRLEALRLEKAERNLKTVERRGRIVPAKFMEQQKQSVKIDDPVISSARAKINRRGYSLGPAEIVSGAKNRFSLSKPEMNTPVSTQNNRRKSCFWKLGEIDELKVTKERGKSSSVSPRLRKTASKVQAPPKQALTTVGSKRPVKKEDGYLALIQPKTLFKDGEKSAPNKKSVKPGRVVPSRYNQIPTNQSNGNLSEARKRSLPDSDKEDGYKRHASRGNGLSQKMESSRVKKKWEIPGEVVVVYRSDTSEESPVMAAGDLPKIRTNRRVVVETPRDSGAAKRVADLVGRKSYFTANDDDDDAQPAAAGVCQMLSFAEEDDDDIQE